MQPLKPSQSTNLLIEAYWLLRGFEPENGWHPAIRTEQDVKEWLERVVMYLNDELAGGFANQSDDRIIK